MLRFQAIFDGYKFSKSTLQYAIQISQLSEAHLTGVFLDDFIYHNYEVASIYKKGKKEVLIAKHEILEKEKKMRDDAVIEFQQGCTKAGIQFSIHRDKSIAIQELKHESIFGDLVIINKKETFTRFNEKQPTRFIKNLLADVHCPVLVVPDKFKLIDKLILLYDGRPSALYAHKMFGYICAGLKNLPVEVFSVNEAYLSNMHLVDNKLMREFVKIHYPKAKITVVKGNAEEQVTGHLRNHKENELVVLGAYRRSELSRIFKESMADLLLKELDTPLFIAHS